MRQRLFSMGGLVASDGGAGSVLAVALVAAVMVIAGIATPLAFLLPTRHAVAGAADAAALAAADVAAGLYPGYPCEVAAHVAAANVTHLRDCHIDGLVISVTVERGVLGFAVSASATAGPPD